MSVASVPLYWCQYQSSSTALRIMHWINGEILDRIEIRCRVNTASSMTPQRQIARVHPVRCEMEAETSYGVYLTIDENVQKGDFFLLSLFWEVTSIFLKTPSRFWPICPNKNEKKEVLFGRSIRHERCESLANKSGIGWKKWCANLYSADVSSSYSFARESHLRL